ncbi:N-acetylmuramidase family protein [Pseudomonas sp. C9-3]|uniref:N-acetylmuramidase family protein n=1 Tax=Pseudomonas sp. C9-3 TaxID=3078264 RepID=UPI0028E75064|nr:N-acetylmuramidase family protein [Pseudomonas sp. C9-3]
MTTLRYGDRGTDVHTLQQRLNVRAGARLTADGHYGAATEAAVRTFQQRVGLVADGIAGPKTQQALYYDGADPRHLRDAQLAAVAERLGAPLAGVYAVNEVESQGEGFLPNGKPKILFERHIMYRQLGKPRADQFAAQQPSLVNPTPGGYVGKEAEHTRLALACLIDETAALESASWGAFQIMGYHWRRLGYASVQDFVGQMCTSEANQFEAFARFIETDPALLKALKARKWADFARLYNGPDYKRNLYDVKLERAYERHSTALAA